MCFFVKHPTPCLATWQPLYHVWPRGRPFLTKSWEQDNLSGFRVFELQGFRLLGLYGFRVLRVLRASGGLGLQGIRAVEFQGFRAVRFFSFTPLGVWVLLSFEAAGL